MRAVLRSSATSAAYEVERLARRVVHPLCGLDTRVGFVLRGRHEPRFAVAGAELTGVHRLLGQDKAGSYHIGGVGLNRSEALVRAIGESVERYCQLVSVVGGTVPIRIATIEQVAASGRKFLSPDDLSFFSADQYARQGFPFQPPVPGAPYGWAEMTATTSGEQWLVPAQLAFVGYGPHRGLGEPWLVAAVTTGTATHRTRPAATRGALLELIQLDTAMGHWYGAGQAPRIGLGTRLEYLRRIVERQVPSTTMLSFHYLASPDLPGQTVAAVIRQAGQRRPSVVVGLGCETRLIEACYKALLEAVGVLQLAKMGMSDVAAAGTRAGTVDDEQAIFDLDRNVGHYADGGGDDVIAHKFPDGNVIDDADLPVDRVGPDEEIVGMLADGITRSGARLFERELTTMDTAALGMVTARVWSPDLISLAMPSAPPLAHPRFAAYGGASQRRPHPYP